ncbi:MAG: hypothetical protein IPJ46_16250, partial [Anaerolineales bacterium]|nr:hypothetical protein [Anaerolineales bacterium]
WHGNAFQSWLYLLAYQQELFQHLGVPIRPIRITATAVYVHHQWQHRAAGGSATITYTGGSTIANATTGNYSFTVSDGWSGTVTPSKAGYAFTPPSRSYANVTANQTNQNYTAVAATPSTSLVTQVSAGRY